MERRAHSCDDIFPTVKKTWVRSKASKFLFEKGTVKPSELSVWIFEKYQIDAERSMLARAIKEAKRDVLDERVPFGAVGLFLEALSLKN